MQTRRDRGGIEVKSTTATGTRDRRCSSGGVVAGWLADSRVELFRGLVAGFARV